MYEKPHLKILGRNFSHKPYDGIPIALESLSDSESHYIDYVSAGCYLAYRAIDGTYSDANMAWDYLCKAEKVAEGFSLGVYEPWFVARWLSSLKIAKIYMRIHVFKEDFPMKEVVYLANSNYCMLHPPQVVNAMRANALLILFRYLNDKAGQAEEQIYWRALPAFQKAIMLYKPAKEYDLGMNMASEIQEASECLFLIMKMRNTFNSPTVENMNALKSYISSKVSSRSYGIYYQALEKIFNQRKQ